MNNHKYDDLQKEVVYKVDTISGRSSILPALFLALYAALVPFDNVLWLTKGWGTITKYLGIMLALVVLADRIVIGHGRIARPPSAALWWLLFAGVAVFSLIWSADQQATTTGLITLAGLIAVFLLVIIQPWNLKDLKIIETGILIGGVAVSALAIYLRFAGIFYPLSERASLVFGQRLIDPNHLVASLILPISLALNLMLEKKRSSLLTTAAFFLMALAITLTGSRGGLMGFSAASIYLYWKKRPSIRAVVLLVLIAALAIVFLPKFLTPALEERYSLQTIFASQAGGRFPLWRAAITAFWERPLTGWGYESFSMLTGGLGSQGAHNIYLQTLSELGMVGLISLIIGLFTSYRIASRHALTNPFYRGVAAALLGIAIASLSLGTLNYKYFWLTLMLALSVTSEGNDVTEESLPRHNAMLNKHVVHTNAPTFW